ncbi:MAG TPA: 3-hydroxyacyl-CoA dehydrogenase NAD-binding domain-containing protein, partial [Vicinamibacterales bacterium]|nr:3-hydroxyacyl-CoA dehydrogenase NAD-binding domain-containing protein [Vicinamibacterales bacterium]
MRRLGHATVLGAGTMGAQIAAHLANAGVPCLLLDVTAQAARDGLERARRLRPDPFFTPDTHRLITTGAFETDLPAVARSDWIIEAIVERLDAKRDLYARLEAHLGAGAIVSSNTSGIPIAALGEGRSERFRRHFLGTHFFNPPRYLPLLEVIPSADTDPAVVDTVRVIADHRLGKSVVVAKDTPGFIGNRIALFGVARLLAMLERGWTIEEIDAVTGAPLGRPKSATFRTMDLAGLDILVHVANDLAARLSEAERDAFRLPAFVHELVRRGWTGEKAGRGFYRRASQEEGGGLLVLDPATLEYRPSRPVTLPAIEAARAIEDPGDRIRTLFLGRDRVGELLRLTLGPSLLYAARVAPDIAHSIDDIDRAMRWGFGWELGPFETWDAVGLEEVLRACAAEAPLLVRARLDESARTGAPAAFRPLEPDRSAVAPRRYRLVPPA